MSEETFDPQVFGYVVGSRDANLPCAGLADYGPDVFVVPGVSVDVVGGVCAPWGYFAVVSEGETEENDVVVAGCCRVVISGDHIKVDAWGLHPCSLRNGVGLIIFGGVVGSYEDGVFNDIEVGVEGGALLNGVEEEGDWHFGFTWGDGGVVDDEGEPQNLWGGDGAAEVAADDLGGAVVGSVAVEQLALHETVGKGDVHYVVGEETSVGYWGA